jgi:hypothetical protein
MIQSPVASTYLDKDKLDVITEYLKVSNPNFREMKRKKALLSNMQLSAALDLD